MTTASQGRPTDSHLTVPPAIMRGADPDIVSVERLARQSGMSVQRTRMGAGRTLTSVIRTPPGLISSGITIFRFFQRLYADDRAFVAAAWHRGGHQPDISGRTIRLGETP
ncbi:MAG TPA: hypothetical protein VMD53_07440 [Rhizomicrobium sp.]|nr:hypothetical protein [Rhizomicrobium sp.]